MLRTVVYLDWDTTRRLDTKRENSTVGIERAFAKLHSAISKSLTRKDSKAQFRVYWRVYHGWHTGKTKTADRRIFEEYAGLAKATSIDRVSFSTDFTYSGDDLCGTHRAPIYDTLRHNKDSGKTSQKMVDTMLACDLLHLSRTKEYTYHIVVASDDDLIPAIITAEAWKAKVFLLHPREQLNQFLNLTGIAQKMDLT